MSKHPFKISSALKDIIGRDLITSDTVAIFELVKNAIDADANRIDLVFDHDGEKCRRILIIDDGSGMSEGDIRSKWLFLGYSAKRHERSPKKYAGNKGVGRFSCDRLGRTLLLQTRKSANSPVSQVNIDWGDYENDDLMEFGKIKVGLKSLSTFSVNQVPVKIRKGTVLEIGELREPLSWNRSKLLDLRQSLAALIDPFDAANSRYKIVLHADAERVEDDVEVEAASEDERIARVVNGRVTNDVVDLIDNVTTRLTTKIHSEGKIESILHDRGELIFHILEPLSSEFSELMSSRFQSTIFSLNRSAKILFNKSMGMSSKEYGSIFLYKNGFRIFPVGEPDDDYWGISKRKQQGIRRYLGTRDLMGTVAVYGDDTVFKESSSRDKGFIDTQASAELRRFVFQHIVRVLERYVVGIGWSDPLDQDQSTPVRMLSGDNRSKILKLISSLTQSDGVELIDYNPELVEIVRSRDDAREPSLGSIRQIAAKQGDDALLEEVEKAERALRSAKALEKQAMNHAAREEEARREAEKRTELARSSQVAAEKALEEELARNQFLVASTSRDKEHLEDFVHNIIIHAQSCSDRIGRTLKLAKRDPDSRIYSVNDELFAISNTLKRIIATARYLTQANFRLSSGEITGDFIAFIQQHVDIMANSYISRVRSSVTLDKSCKNKEFVRRFSPMDVGMVLDNIITNSKKNRANQVDFNLVLQGKVLMIAVCDNGRGLGSDVSEPDRIFDKGFTRTNGSGLGLYFCKNKIEEMGGSVNYDDSCKSGFGLLIKIPK